MKEFTKHSVIVLAILAIACAQVFGLKRTYICSCAGELIETRVDHCHGEHSSHADHHAPDLPLHQHADDDDSEGDTHHHTPLHVELKAQGKGLVSIGAPMPTLAVLSEVGCLFVKPAWTLPNIALSSKPPPDIGESPPASLQVAKCTVFLI